MTILIIEGVVATGKSTLMTELQNTELWRDRPTKILLSEHYTERVLELTAPTLVTRLELLGRYVAMMESMHQIWSASRFKQERMVEPLAICERFHLTHAAQSADFAPFSDVEQRLYEMDAFLVFLHHPPSLLLERIRATEQTRGAMWRRWLRSIGSDQEVADYFLSLQVSSAAFFAASRLKKIAIEAHSAPVACLAAQLSRLLLG